MELVGDLRPEKNTYKLYLTDQISGHKGIGVYSCSVDICGHIDFKAAPELLSSVKKTMRFNRKDFLLHQALHR